MNSHGSLDARVEVNRVILLTDEFLLDFGYCVCGEEMGENVVGLEFGFIWTDDSLSAKKGVVFRERFQS